MSDGSVLPELLSGLAEVIAKAITQTLDVSYDVALAIGIDVAQQIAEMWGGQLIYVPKGVLMQSSKLRQDIYDDWAGHNQKELATKHKVSLAYVYRVIKQMHALRLASVQGDMFHENKDDE